MAQRGHKDPSCKTFKCYLENFIAYCILCTQVQCIGNVDANEQGVFSPNIVIVMYCIALYNIAKLEAPGGSHPAFELAT